MDGSISEPVKTKRSRPVLVAEEIKEWVVKKDLAISFQMKVK